MDTGSIRPLPGGAALAPVRTDVVPVRDAVQTELQTAVQTNASTEKNRFGQADRERTAQEREADARQRGRQERGFYRDDQTGELVYRAVDALTGTVISQSPEEAIIRLRAYLKQAEERSADIDALNSKLAGFKASSVA